jgi:hypothetical protein
MTLPMYILVDHTDTTTYMCIIFTFFYYSVAHLVDVAYLKRGQASELQHQLQSVSVYSSHKEWPL